MYGMPEYGRAYIHMYPHLASLGNAPSLKMRASVNAWLNGVMGESKWADEASQGLDWAYSNYIRKANESILSDSVSNTIHCCTSCSTIITHHFITLATYVRT